MIPANIIRQDEVNVIFVRSELDDAGLNPFEFRVYAHIARRSNCYAKMDNIGAICGMSGRQARRSLMSLAEKGMIEMITRAGQTHMITLMPPRNWSEKVWDEIRKNRSGWKSESPEQGRTDSPARGDSQSGVGRTVSPPKDIPPKGIPLKDIVDAAASPHPPQVIHPIEAIPNPQTPSSAAPLSPCPPAPKKPRPRDPIIDAIVTACGGDPLHQTQSQWGMAAKAKKEILAVDPNVTPTAIIQFGIRKRREWKVASCTPIAITKHWESQQAGSPAASEGDPFEGRAVVPYEEVRERFGEGPEAVRIVAMLESQGRIEW